MNEDIKDVIKALLGGLGVLEALIAWVLVSSALTFAAFILYLLINILLMLPAWVLAFVVGMFVPALRKKVLDLISDEK